MGKKVKEGWLTCELAIVKDDKNLSIVHKHKTSGIEIAAGYCCG